MARTTMKSIKMITTIIMTKMPIMTISGDNHH